MPDAFTGGEAATWDGLRSDDIDLPLPCVGCDDMIRHGECICCVRGKWDGKPALYAHCDHVNAALRKCTPDG